MILEQDLEEIICKLGQKWNSFREKTFLITGATGLIGSLTAKTLIKLNLEKDAKIKIILVARSEENARKVFDNLESITNTTVHIQPDITAPININEKIDYVIHAASPTNAKFYSEKPVETINTIFTGTQRVLELSKQKNVSKIIFLSSMEAYGKCGNTIVKESDQGFVDLNNVRSSYPIGKRSAEFLTYAYHAEYNMPTIIARLAMCFGAGQKPDDKRVHKVFCKAALNKQDIEVKSSGKTKINFVYSADAILAILLLILDGKPGETYNIAGNALNYTIMDMAKYIAKLGEVKINHIKSTQKVFAPDDEMLMDTRKLSGLGWEPNYNIEQALNRYINFLKEEKL